jgi:hypothetical protein
VITAASTPQGDVPSLKTLLTATLTALLVAAAMLVVVVLPAEYGLDPLGTGRLLGLTELASASEKPAPRPAAGKAPEPMTASIVPVLVPSPTGDAPTMKNTFIAQPHRYQIDSREITLAPREGMEIKYNMKKGAGLLYSWTASGTLQFEFHGEPDVKPAGKESTDYYESYELDRTEGKNQAHGTFIAPSTGIHGWFWENPGSSEVKLKLVAAGFFDWVMQNRKNKQTALKPMDVYALPSHPTVPDEISR